MNAQTAMNLPAPPAHERMLLSMISNMEALTELYKVELDALELRDMEKFADLQAEKNRLVQDCEARMSEIKNQTQLMKTVNPVMKERIYVAEGNLRHLALRSQRACQIRTASVKRVQERLLDAARHILLKDQKFYNNKGQSDMARSRPTATAINQAI